jgi:hypothetical protein
MKYLIIFFTFLLIFDASAKTTLKEIQKEAKNDNDGKLYLEGFHSLIAPHAINPVSLSDKSIIGDKSFRFEVNHGECGQEPKWSDCDTDRERSELYYEWGSKNNHDNEKWKKEKWYRFYVFVPKEHNILAPSQTSIIQWKRRDPSKVLIMFRYHHGGLYFDFNGDTFYPGTFYHLKNDKDMRDKWTEILFNTNWHPSADKGFMKVWIDGKMRIDYKGIANHPSNGKNLNLRYGIYSSALDKYRAAFNEIKHKQRVLYFDGVKGDTSCDKLLKDKKRCNELLSQKVIEYFKYDPEGGWDTSKKLEQYDLNKLGAPLKLEIKSEQKKLHNHLTNKEINFLMTAKGEEELCIRKQFGSGLDLLRKDTVSNQRYSNWSVYSTLQEIVKDCSN